MPVHVSEPPPRRYYLRTQHPMPELAPAAHFSKVFSDYLSSPQVLAFSGVPSLTAVRRRHLTSTDPIVNPNLLITVEVAADSNDTLLTLTVKLELTVQLGTAAGQTTAAQAEAWLKSLRSALTDSPDALNAWDAWTLTLSDAAKTGWYVQSIYPQNTESDLSQDTNVLTLTALYQVISYWDT